MIKTALTMLGIAISTLTTLNAAAQAFPESKKPLTITVPFPAGGPTDKVAREVGLLLGNALGAPVVIENVAGAGGTIGAKKASMAKPDGYSIFLHHIGMATSPALYRNLNFSPVNDFEPIGSIADVPMLLIGRKDLPAANLADAVMLAKKNPNKVTLANAGLGSASHLCGMLFMSAAQVNMNVIPYKGTGQPLIDMMSGQIDLMCDQTTNIASQVRAGTVKPFAAMQAARVPSFSDVPSAGDAGFKQIEIQIWHGLYAPKGTPAAVIDRLSQALQQVVAEPKFRAKMTDLGAEAVATDKATPAFLRKHLAAEIAKWTPLIKQAGVYAD